MTRKCQCPVKRAQFHYLYLRTGKPEGAQPSHSICHLIPAFAQAVDTLDEMSIQGWFSGADGAYWQRCPVDLTLRDRRGRLISMADASKHATVNSSSIEELYLYGWHSSCHGRTPAMKVSSHPYLDSIKINHSYVQVNTIVPCVLSK